jgi:hypothetical protein
LIGDWNVKTATATRRCAKQEGRLRAGLDRLRARIQSGKLVNPLKIGEAIGRLKERCPRVARYCPIADDAAAKDLTVTATKTTTPAPSASTAGTCSRATARTCRPRRTGASMPCSPAEAAFRDNEESAPGAAGLSSEGAPGPGPHLLCACSLSTSWSPSSTPCAPRAFIPSWVTLRDRLKAHQVCTIVLPTTAGATVRIRRALIPEQEHLDSYRLLDIPTDVLTPKRTWSETSPERHRAVTNKTAKPLLRNVSHQGNAKVGLDVHRIALGLLLPGLAYGAGWNPADRM